MSWFNSRLCIEWGSSNAAAWRKKIIKLKQREKCETIKRSPPSKWTYQYWSVIRSVMMLSYLKKCVWWYAFRIKYTFRKRRSLVGLLFILYIYIRKNYIYLLFYKFWLCVHNFTPSSLSLFSFFLLFFFFTSYFL